MRPRRQTAGAPWPVLGARRGQRHPRGGPGPAGKLRGAAAARRARQRGWLRAAGARGCRSVPRGAAPPLSRGCDLLLPLCRSPFPGGSHFFPPLPSAPPVPRGCRCPSRPPCPPRGSVPSRGVPVPPVKQRPAPAAPRRRGCTRVRGHMCVPGHTCGTAVRVTQQGHGWVQGSLLASPLWAHAWIVPAWPAWVLGHLVLSPLGQGPGGCVGEAPAVGGWVRSWVASQPSPACRGFVRCQRGGAAVPRHPGPVGVREGTRGHPACATAGTCGRQVAAGAWGGPAALSEGIYEPWEWWHGAVPGVPPACARAGHLLRTGEVFAQPALGGDWRQRGV